MSVTAADPTSHHDERPPSLGLWMAAAAEIAVALVVAAILLRTGRPPSTAHTGPGMHQHHSAQVHWQAAILAFAALTAAMLVWWLTTRTRLPAVVAAAGLVGLGATGEVRSLALQSHLIAMVILEALLVGVPLLLVASSRPGPTRALVGRSPAWTGAVTIAVVLNSALLIGLHLPAIHNRASAQAMVPVWLVALTVAVGLGYWAAILRTPDGVSPALRHGALIIGQEVAAILGLAALLWPSPRMQHTNPLGLSPTADQRLGGLVMLIACAAVTLPLARRLQNERACQGLRTEQYDH